MTDRLDLRLYFDPAYTEMARAIGYAGISLSKGRKHIERLAKRFDREKLVVVIEDIARIEGPKGPKDEGAMFLTDEAKGLCWQLLGAPPGHPDYVEPEAEKPAKPRSRKRAAKGR